MGLLNYFLPLGGRRPSADRAQDTLPLLLDNSNRSSLDSSEDKPSPSDPGKPTFQFHVIRPSDESIKITIDPHSPIPHSHSAPPSPKKGRASHGWTIRRQVKRVRAKVCSRNGLLVWMGVLMLYVALRTHDVHTSTPNADEFDHPLEPRPEPVEHLVEPFNLSLDSNTHRNLNESIQRELLYDRLEAQLGLVAPTLQCALSALDERMYAPLKEGGPYLLASSPFNSERVIPTLSRTLLELADFLGPEKTHVSIVEDGSTDNVTRAMAHLAAALTARGVGHSILSDKRKTDWSKVDRIAQLSVCRNLALSAVNSTAQNGQAFKDVVFINDVFLCPPDVLELLHQRRLQQAHAACAVEWRSTRSWLRWLGHSTLEMVDIEGTQSVTRRGPRSWPDLLLGRRYGALGLFDRADDSERSRARWRAGQAVPLPFPSTSFCSNGLLALPAAPFQSLLKALPPLLYSPDLSSDLEARGLERWIVVPSVRATQDEVSYDHPSLQELARKAMLAPPPGMRRKIDWSRWGESKRVREVVVGGDARARVREGAHRVWGGQGRSGHGREGVS